MGVRTRKCDISSEVHPIRHHTSRLPDKLARTGPSDNSPTRNGTFYVSNYGENRQAEGEV